MQVPSHLNSVLSGASAVIHMAEMLDRASTDLSLMQDINVEGTKNVVEACLASDVKALVFKSTGQHSQISSIMAMFDAPWPTLTPRRVVYVYHAKESVPLLILARFSPC